MPLRSRIALIGPANGHMGARPTDLGAVCTLSLRHRRAVSVSFCSLLSVFISMSSFSVLAGAFANNIQLVNIVLICLCLVFLIRVWFMHGVQTGARVELGREDVLCCVKGNLFVSVTFSVRAHAFLLVCISIKNV